MSDLTVIASDGVGDDVSDSAAELKRVLEICNACRYCEGFCATFQALSRRRRVVWSDLDYLSNLCHNCTACYHACQYSPPHEFSINAPLAFSRSRAESYERYAWPGFLGSLFQKNGLVVSLITAVMLTLTMVVGSTMVNHEVLFSQHQSPGAFYQIVSHEFIVATAGAIFLFSIVAIAVGVSRFCSASNAGSRFSLSALWEAVKSAATLNNLGGGHGKGLQHRRRIFQ